jgi:hypothetical protein
MYDRIEPFSDKSTQETKTNGSPSERTGKVVS